MMPLLRAKELRQVVQKAQATHALYYDRLLEEVYELLCNVKRVALRYKANVR